MVRTSFPEIGAEHMLQSLTAGCGRTETFATDRVRPEVDVGFRVSFGARRLPPRPHADFDERAHRHRIFLDGGQCRAGAHTALQT
jgi:hypothetical protein